MKALRASSWAVAPNADPQIMLSASINKLSDKRARKSMRPPLVCMQRSRFDIAQALS
jgi:hypothetical protein